MPIASAMSKPGKRKIRSHHFSQLIALTELAPAFIGCEFRVINEIYGLGFAAEALGKTLGHGE